MMRAPILSAVVSVGLALAVCPQAGRTQADRDFVFTDTVGHLVIRFAGTGATGLNSWQREEVLDSEFSRMVHDRLRADLLFEAEPPDPEWAASMEPLIAEHVEHAGPEFSGIFTECRKASCRVIMEQPVHWTVTAHQAVLDTVQKSLEAFIAAHRQDFEPIFMMTAYDKEHEIPHIKAFLRRAGRAPDRPRKGGFPPDS
ncbi:MAG TPA: hypothetical protein VF329_06110 [Gammaproteobacteria bacterium]